MIPKYYYDFILLIEYLSDSACPTLTSSYLKAKWLKTVVTARLETVSCIDWSEKTVFKDQNILMTM